MSLVRAWTGLPLNAGPDVEAVHIQNNVTHGMLIIIKEQLTQEHCIIVHMLLWNKLRTTVYMYMLHVHYICYMYIV